MFIFNMLYARDSSGKSAMSVANEDLQRIARPLRSKGHAQVIEKIQI